MSTTFMKHMVTGFRRNTDVIKKKMLRSTSRSDIRLSIPKQIPGIYLKMNTNYKGNVLSKMCLRKSKVQPNPLSNFYHCAKTTSSDDCVQSFLNNDGFAWFTLNM